MPNNQPKNHTYKQQYVDSIGYIWKYIYVHKNTYIHVVTTDENEAMNLNESGESIHERVEGGRGGGATF